MRRLAAALAIVPACLVLPVAASAGKSPDPAAPSQSAVGSWAEAQIRTVIARGLMGGRLATFRPADALTRQELSELVTGLSQPKTAPSPSPAPSSAPVSLAGLDAQLVRALGLNAAANRFVAAARRGGLTPPSRFGTEVVARLLHLRINHQAPDDDLELLPGDPATRAEAAFSAARVLVLESAELEAVKNAAASIELPELDEWQRRVLNVAVGLIGYPYVWGGLSERTQVPLGVKRPGGFDCSGFVWRVYKLERYAGGEALAATLKGRSSYALSGEVSKSRRIRLAQLEPADVVFFGDRGVKSNPDEVGHMGIYLGSGWFIHSSEYGVALARIADWYRSRFAWGRRPLAEAGLTEV